MLTFCDFKLELFLVSPAYVSLFSLSVCAWLCCAKPEGFSAEE